MKEMNTIFAVGTVTNPLTSQVSNSRAVLAEIILNYPARLNAMALDPSRIDLSEDGIYMPGEILFSIDIYKEIKIRLRTDAQILVSESSPRQQLIRHAALLMQHALSIDTGFDIDVKGKDVRHCGLGSSGSLIAGVASAINEMYGNPISKNALVRYLAQNHGEEIEGDEEHLHHVQCIGGSAASGLVQGGMKVLAGESVPIASMDIEESYTVLIGIPKDFVAPDAQTLMQLEINNLHKFISSGEKYKNTIGYRVVHETIPSMVQNDLRQASKLIFDYRFAYGSIENCSFVYPRIVEIAKSIRHLYEDNLVDTLALSSVGPAFFALTRKPEICLEVFEANNLETMTAHIVNTGYQVLTRVSV